MQAIRLLGRAFRVVRFEHLRVQLPHLLLLTYTCRIGALLMLMDNSEGFGLAPSHSPPQGLFNPNPKRPNPSQKVA